MRMALVILLMFVSWIFSPAAMAAEESGKKKPSAGTSVSEEDKKVIELMEILEVMEILENMDMIKDLNILIEED